ncbi:MAG: hypothetical protein ACI4J6_07780 [Oscillospiraceae bacterium]
MAKIKYYASILLLGLALCGCKAEDAATDSAGTEESIGEISLLEKKIIGASDIENTFVYPAFSGDLDGDGEEELFAVCGTGGTFGSLWYASTERADEICTAQAEWGEFRTAEVGGDTLILAERLSATDSVTYCFRVESETPLQLDTFGAGLLTQTGEAEFTGLQSTYDLCTDGTGHTQKPYWFRYEDGSFKEYRGRSILYENFKDGFGGVTEDFAYLKPYFDEIEAENGEISNFIVRDNGIVNINYTVGEEGKEFFAYRYFRTLLVNNGEVTDVTPENNGGSYKVSITGDLLDERMY